MGRRADISLGVLASLLALALLVGAMTGPQGTLSGPTSPASEVRPGTLLGGHPVRPATAPSAPLDVQVAPENGAANVSWAAPATLGGEPVRGYIVAWTPPSALENRTDVGNTTHTWVSALTNGVPYSFQVAAWNAAGTGPFSTPAVTVIPGVVPGSPTNLSVRPSNESLKLNWTAPVPSPGYPAQEYWVSLGEDGTSSLVETPSVVYTFSGLLDGTEYRLAVQAQNALGVGSWSRALFATPYGPPGAPRDVVAVGSAPTAVSVSWTASGWTGGAPVNNFTIEWSASNGGRGTGHASPNATSWTLWGAVPGVSYTLSVFASGRGGQGPAVSATASPGPRGLGSATALYESSVVLLIFALLFTTVLVCSVMLGRSDRQRREHEAAAYHGFVPAGPPTSPEDQGRPPA